MDSRPLRITFAVATTVDVIETVTLPARRSDPYITDERLDANCIYAAVNDSRYEVVNDAARPWRVGDTFVDETGVGRKVEAARQIGSRGAQSGARGSWWRGPSHEGGLSSLLRALDGRPRRRRPPPMFGVRSSLHPSTTTPTSPTLAIQALRHLRDSHSHQRT